MGRVSCANSLRYGYSLSWAKQSNLALLNKTDITVDQFKKSLSFFYERLLWTNDMDITYIPGNIRVNLKSSTVQIEIDLHDFSAETLSFDRRLENTLLSLETFALERAVYFFQKPCVIRFFFFKSHRGTSAIFVLNYFKMNIRKKFTAMEVLIALQKILKHAEGVVGYRLEISGRYGKQERATRLCLKKGKISLTTLSSNIEYEEDFILLKHGKCGLKVWINRETTVAESIVQK